MNCEVDGSSGSMICAWTPSTPGTPAMARIVAAGRMPPAGNPVPIPMPRPATEIWPSTKRSPPSMKRTMRSLMAPSATSPATPMVMPSTVKRYPRKIRSDRITTGVALRSRRRPDRVRDGREARRLRIDPVRRAQPVWRMQPVVRPQPVLRGKPAHEGRDHVGHPARRERLEREQRQQHRRGGGRRSRDERAARARVVPPHDHAVDDVLDRRAADGHRPERRRAGILGGLLERRLVAHAPALTVEGLDDRAPERPAAQRPPRRMAAGRHAGADGAEAAPLAAGGPRGARPPGPAPAAGAGGPQPLGLEHEPAATRPDVVEELDRVDAKPGLRV